MKGCNVDFKDEPEEDANGLGAVESGGAEALLELFRTSVMKLSALNPHLEVTRSAVKRQGSDRASSLKLLPSLKLLVQCGCPNWPLSRTRVVLMLAVLWELDCPHVSSLETLANAGLDQAVSFPM
jgi:hypothetical protein